MSVLPAASKSILTAALILGLSLGLGALLPAPAEAAEARQGTSPGTPQKARKPARAAVVDTPPYGLREDVQAWIRELQAAHPQWPAEWVERTIGGARHIPQVTQLIMPPPVGTAKNWAAYRDRFVEPRRIAAGVAFWREHADALARAEARWGVPAEIIVGIIGVETLYGRHMGRLKTVDALATLAFDFPSGRSDRSAFFRSELAALLELAMRDGIELDNLRGSYAGALGWPQFMPSSWLRHAVDFDGDGHVALHESPVDAIGSVANFLAAHGWQPGMPSTFGVSPPGPGDALATLLAPDIKPTFSASAMAQLGAALDEAALDHPGPLALVKLENGDTAAPTYVAGTQNFWALTRYNWSAYYASAVLELGRTVARAR